MNLFVSQPMTGLTEEDIIDTRNRIMESFPEGTNIIDNLQFDDRSPAEHLGHDITMMKDADAIIFTKGWEKRDGCIIEFMCAKKFNIPMYFE